MRIPAMPSGVSDKPSTLWQGRSIAHLVAEHDTLPLAPPPRDHGVNRVRTAPQRMERMRDHEPLPSRSAT